LIPEQPIISFVRLDVIDVAGNAAAADAVSMYREIRRSSLAPLASISTL
jgi:hypothetical protein